MPGAIRIPNTIGNITLNADIRARQIVASISLDSPTSGRSKKRINWLLRQLKATSPNVRLDSWGLRSRSSMSDLLENVRKKPSLLIPTDNRDIVAFTVSINRPMGDKRARGKNSFIDSVLNTLDDFYGDVVQHLKEWQPEAPKLQRPEVIETEVAARDQIESDSGKVIEQQITPNSMNDATSTSSTESTDVDEERK